MVDNRKASRLVRHLRASGEDKENLKQQARRCSCSYCPLIATINFGGEDTCTYHSQQERRYWADITLAINNNIDLIKHHSQMTRWSITDWSEQYHLLSQFPLCPMTELDRKQPTNYLNKFGKAIKDKILNEASGGNRHGFQS